MEACHANGNTKKSRKPVSLTKVQFRAKNIKQDKASHLGLAKLESTIKLSVININTLTSKGVEQNT